MRAISRTGLTVPNTLLTWQQHTKRVRSLSSAA